jgi:hypothetical protein
LESSRRGWNRLLGQQDALPLLATVDSCCAMPAKYSDVRQNQGKRVAAHG